jgi:hypothetical protein
VAENLTSSGGCAREFEDGARLRAKIDMASPNINRATRRSWIRRHHHLTVYVVIY